MSRFVAWFRFEWRSHWKLVSICALTVVFICWLALLIGGRAMGREELEGILVGALALMGIVLGAGLFSSERRHGAESLLLRTPGARVPLFAARLAYVLSANALVALVGAFGAAQLGSMYRSESRSMAEVGAFLWPRYITADGLVLAAAIAAVALLVSVWTRRVALAFVLGVVFPAVLVFPWIYLGASRGDFYPFWRHGAIPLVAWPLLALALLALGFSWLVGRRRLNQQGRAVLCGAIVLLIGLGLGGAWTAQAFASFDDVRPEHPGFRMEQYPIELNVSKRRFNSHLPIDSVALSGDGTRLWVQGFRVDAGTWPLWTGLEPGRRQRDFREDRGTFSRQWWIDLETGEAASVGELEDRIAWTDLGPGRLHGLLSGVGQTLRLAPRSHALIGDYGEFGRVIDLDTSAYVGGSLEGMGYDTSAERVRVVAAASSTVRDAKGRAVWVSVEHPRTPDGKRAGGVPRVELKTLEDSRRIVDETVVAATPAHGTSWLPVPGGWATWRSRVPRIVTIDLEGRVRKSTKQQDRIAAGSRFFTPIVLSPRHALVPMTLGYGGDPDERITYALLDLETGDATEDLEGPRHQYIARAPLPDGRLLCLVRSKPGADGAAASRQFVLWDPRTDTREDVTLDGEPSLVPAGTQLVFDGADGRGNMVFSALSGYARPDPTGRTPLATGMTRTIYFHAASGTLRTLSRIMATPEGVRSAPAASARHVMAPGFQPVGIDAEDRVVGLTDRAGGFRKVVRFDPADGSMTVLFPKRDRGPLR